jgi:hypothetical protein
LGLRRGWDWRLEGLGLALGGANWERPGTGTRQGASWEEHLGGGTGAESLGGAGREALGLAAQHGTGFGELGWHSAGTWDWRWRRWDWHSVRR